MRYLAQTGRVRIPYSSSQYNLIMAKKKLPIICGDHMVQLGTSLQDVESVCAETPIKEIDLDLCKTLLKKAVKKRYAMVAMYRKNKNLVRWEPALTEYKERIGNVKKCITLMQKLKKLIMIHKHSVV